MWRIMLAALAGVVISMGLGTGTSSTGEVAEVQLALGSKSAHCKPSCGPHMTCACRGCDGWALCCVCVPK